MTYHETEEYYRQLEAYRAGITVWSISCKNTNPERRIAHLEIDIPKPTTTTLASFHREASPNEQLCSACYQPGHEANVMRVDPTDEEVREIARNFDVLWQVLGGGQSASPE